MSVKLIEVGEETGHATISINKKNLNYDLPLAMPKHETNCKTVSYTTYNVSPKSNSLVVTGETKLDIEAKTNPSGFAIHYSRATEDEALEI